jgi:AraC family transcriptional regulator
MDHAQSLHSHFSNAVTSDSIGLGWESLRALACNYHTAYSPLSIPKDPEYITVELNTGLRTAVSYQFGNKENGDVSWGPGDIWIYPNTESSTWKWDRPHNTIVFFLPMKRLKQLMLKGLNIDAQNSNIVPGICKNDGTLTNLLQLMSKGMLGEAASDAIYIKALVDATLVHLARNHMVGKPYDPDQRSRFSSSQLDKVRSHVADYVDTPLSVADLAKAAGLPPHEFPRAFRTATGITPYQYVLRERIAWTEHLLRTTDLSLAEVSFVAGFSSQSHFTRTFGKQNSITPQNYRETFR